MASDEKPPTIVEMFATVLKRALGREALLLGGFACVVAVAVLYGSAALAQNIKTNVDAGIINVVEQAKIDRAAAEATAEALRRHMAEEAESRLRQDRITTTILQRLDENAADTRALYKAVITGQKQTRLERPPQPLDGGP